MRHLQEVVVADGLAGHDERPIRQMGRLVRIDAHTGTLAHDGAVCKARLFQYP